MTRSPRLRVAPQKDDGLFHVLTGFDQQRVPIMASHSSPSEPSATPTEPPVAPSTTAESEPATPVNDEKHIPTSSVDDEKRHSIEKRPSLPHHASSPFPVEAPVLGAAGIVLESGEKANAAATAFKDHQSPPTQHELGEKGQDAVAENGGATTSTGTTTEAELTQEESEAEADSEIVFPGTAQLALLTFGLCIATFTVALGESFSWYSAILFLENCLQDSRSIYFIVSACYPKNNIYFYLYDLLIGIDNTIIATAIPKITSVFDSLDDVGWYGKDITSKTASCLKNSDILTGSSYLLTTTALQPSFGRIYTYFNVKYVYLFALVLFELGSVICAAAKNSVMLIVGRAVAGAGASALFSGAMTIVGFSVPLKRRPIYMASISSMFGIASVVGPLLGGVFTDRL